VPPPAPEAWAHVLGALVEQRQLQRCWSLGPKALTAFRAYQHAWKRQARADESASTSAALVKADVQLASVVLVVAEVTRAAAGIAITEPYVVAEDVVSQAAAIVDFCMDCWRALPERDGLALSHKDEVLDRAVARLADWLEQHGGKANRRVLLPNNVAGVRTSADLDQLLERYERVYPGTVKAEPSTGGRPPTMVFAPPRKASPGIQTLLGPNKVSSGGGRSGIGCC
jgi:hypothetical protein